MHFKCDKHLYCRNLFQFIAPIFPSLSLSETITYIVIHLGVTHEYSIYEQSSYAHKCLPAAMCCSIHMYSAVNSLFVPFRCIRMSVYAGTGHAKHAQISQISNSTSTLPHSLTPTLLCIGFTSYIVDFCSGFRLTLLTSVAGTLHRTHTSTRTRTQQCR